MERDLYAAELFLKGYNCSQSVAMAFCDITGLSESFTAKIASSYGGGMGRLREVCGAVSGMLLIAGLLYGYDTCDDDKVKKEHYARVQDLAGKFREQAGSIVCRDILKNPPSDPAPTPRTAEFYAKRPCTRMVMLATRILEDYIAEHPIQS
jgi:C_GCAxxG_C_C family probable redox protein